MSLSSSAPGSASVRRLSIVDPVLDPRQLGARGPGRVLDQVARARPGRRLVEPADVRAQVARHLGGRVGGGDHVAARDVEVVLEQDRDRHRRERLVDRAVEGVDPLDPRARAARQHDHVVAGAQHAAGDLAGVAAVVVMGVVVRAHDPLDRQPAGVEHLAVGGDVDALEVLEQRRAVVPRRGVRALDDVVADQRGDRDRGHVREPDAAGEGAEVVRRSRRNSRWSQSTRSILFTAATRCGTPQQRRR